jgi:hypothetical protein
MTFARLSLFAILGVVACRDATGTQGQQPAPVGSGSAAPYTDKAVITRDPVGSGSGSDATKGDQQDSRWVPAEFKTGAARWKDTGVYLDGKPLTFMTFGELPITLKPTWVKEKASANKPPGCPECPAWKWMQQRFYKFSDYLVALGLDPHKIKELHVYGPKFTQSIIVKRKDFSDRRADGFMFRFGADIGGKAIPQVPEGFANGKTPDKISAVMIYVDKTPPTMGEEGFVLDGMPITGVPYYGEPLRGGVRVYLDDRLAAIIKRQELDAKKATTTSDGELHWSFADWLKSKGVDSSKLVEGWVIREDRRKEKLPWSELAKMSFTASSQASGGVLLGDQKYKASAIALHTRPIKPEELPVILPEEQ